MARYVGPAGLLVGVVVIVAGVLFQATGAVAAVYCSVIGAGIVLAITAATIWLVQTLRHRPASDAIA